MGGEDLPSTNTNLPYHKLANLDMDYVLERLAQGHYQKDIAADLGCAPSALTYHLKQNPAAAAAREAGYELRLDTALDKLERAADSGDLNLARAQETYLRRLEYRAAIDVPMRFGQRPNNVVQVSGDGLQINLVSFSPQSALQQPSDPEQE